MLRTWFISLSCLALFCVMLVMTMHSHGLVLNTRENIQHLEKRKSDLERWYIEHQAVQEKTRQWNQLWEKSVEAGLEPEKWQDYPVNIEDTFFPYEAESILRLLSNNINNEQNFWFIPGFIRVMPVIITDESGNQKRSAVQMQIQGKIMTMVPEM